MRRLLLVLCVFGLSACRTDSELVGSDAPSEVAAAAAANAAAGSTAEVHGRLRTVDGQRVLNLWGTPREMGHAHGYLLREGIVEIINGYALEVLPASSFDRMRPIYISAAAISDDRRAEAEGMAAGMRAAGGAHIDKLGRELEADDILFVNAITDLLSIGCSSLSAWGEATQGDTELRGELAVVRNLDWSDDPELLRNQLIIAYAPSDPGRQRVVSVAFAGYMGCLSCVNEAGVTSLFNMGYGKGAASVLEAARGFSPANLSLRDLLEGGDLDGDGDADADDVEAGLRARQHAGSWILHVLEPRALAGERTPARILEVEAKGVARRNPVSSSALGSHALAATNHMREAYAPRTCSRYRRIEQSASRNEQHFELDAMWSLGESLALPEVVHTMMVVPHSRDLRLRLRAPGASMAASPPAKKHTWSELFDER